MTKEFASEMDKMSYAMGINIGEYVGKCPLEIQPGLVLEGLQDCLKGAPQIPPEEYAAMMRLLQQKMHEAAEKQTSDLEARNAAEEVKFMEENKKKDGVKVTASGLQYLVLKEGTGAKPSATQTVRVHYTGKLLNGNVFDSSVQRGTPAEFALNQVIPGWTEGLQLMKEGASYRFFIPAALAYGKRGAPGAIPPNAALIFDVELLKLL